MVNQATEVKLVPEDSEGNEVEREAKDFLVQRVTLDNLDPQDPWAPLDKMDPRVNVVSPEKLDSLE